MKSVRSGSGVLALFVALLGPGGGGADTYPRQPVDVLHYDVGLRFAEDFAFDATLSVDVRLLADAVGEIHLDLDGPTVEDVTAGGRPLPFRHEGARVTITLPRGRPRGSIVPLVVRYRGRPDGRALLARPNAYGRRALFADNWPEGARRWLPTVDHPSDKATVDFAVTAPERYDVVAPGRLLETRSLLDGQRLTRWSEPAAIPTYSMVVGVAEFQVTRIGTADGIPLSVWVFPQDSAAAARMFDRTSLMLEYYSDLLGPFPYAKLAQVQSTSRYAGMENAGAIFYAETELQGPNVDEFPVAHEIAHQWWGDSVTPADWDDLWLSEGFATYFDVLFYEHLEGREELRRRMAEAARKVVELEAKRPGAIVDPAITDPQKKLTGLVYQKGAWVLHMLRRRIGDGVFFDAMREFYRRHAGGNATTQDLQRVLEAMTGEPLDVFFQQWLRRSGMPDLRVRWTWEEATEEAYVEVAQVQEEGPYEVPLELAFLCSGDVHGRTIELREADEAARFSLPGPPSGLEIDPETWLLHVATVEGLTPDNARSTSSNEVQDDD
jgi:aminopeptidase N